MQYQGTIVAQSLIDPRFVDGVEVLVVRDLPAQKPEDRWRLYTVLLTKEQITELSKNLKPEKWYAHFWDDQNILVVYPGMVIKIDRYDKTTWKPAIDHGISLGVPKEELDFLIEE